MDQYFFREARPEDLPAIERIFDDAVARMLAEGKKQWTEKYPKGIHALADMNLHQGYVMELNGRVVAYGAVIFTGEPAYDHLRGSWLGEGPYVVVHRLAVSLSAQRRGIARRFFAAVERTAADRGVFSVRVDTNFDNNRMLQLFDRLGFEYCGDVTYESGHRMAFEKRL